MIENAEQWATDGWGGYIGPDYIKGGVVQVSVVTPKLTLDQAKASMKPLTDMGNIIGNGTAMTVNITTLNEGYHDFMDTTFIKAFTILNNVGLAPASRLIPREFFQTAEKQQTLLSALTGMVEAGEPNPIVPYYILLVPPASYTLPDTDIPPNGPGAASMTPVWVSSPLPPTFSPLVRGLYREDSKLALYPWLTVANTSEGFLVAHIRPNLLGPGRSDGLSRGQCHPGFS